MKGTLRITAWQVLSADRRLEVKGLEFESFSSRQPETGDFLVHSMHISTLPLPIMSWLCSREEI